MKEGEKEGKVKNDETGGCTCGVKDASEQVSYKALKGNEGRAGRGADDKRQTTNHKRQATGDRRQTTDEEEE